MTTSTSTAAPLSPAKIFALAVIWAASTVILQLLTGSAWWLSALGGAGAVALALSFILPEPKTDESQAAEQTEAAASVAKASEATNDPDSEPPASEKLTEPKSE